MDHHRSNNGENSGELRSNIDASNGATDEHDTSRVSDEASAAIPSSPAWYHNTSQITAMLSNFSTSYNVVNISLVLPILEQLYPTSNSEDAAGKTSCVAVFYFPWETNERK